MKHAQRRAKMSGFCLLMAISCLTLLGCEDPGLVGGGFTDTDTEIKVDTLELSNVESQSLVNYSGRLSFISAGRFNDPVFGDIEAIGLVRPSISTAVGDSMSPDASMKLRLVVSQANMYGESETAAEFDLVELDQVWRGKAWKLNDPVQLSSDPPVASFTINQQDSIDIPLSDEWVQKYRAFYEDESSDADSLYRIQFPGLAIVPKNSAKIAPIYSDSSSFLIENPDADTVDQSISDWAYSLYRTNSQEAPAGTFKAHSTLEEILAFDMQLTRDELGSVNISRVELVLYEDKDFLVNSLSSDALRPPIATASLHLTEPELLPVAIDPGTPLIRGQYNADDNSIRFNLTSFVNGVLLDGVSPALKFYVTLQTNNGILRSSLLHNTQAPASKRPKLIVTSIQNEAGGNTN